MPRFRYTPSQSAQLRERIAREAARLLMRGKVKSFHAARTRAARWLSQEKLSSAEIPTQEEIAHELQALTRTGDWDQLSRIEWVIQQTYAWLKPCQPWLFSDWKQSHEPQGITLNWLVSLSERVHLEQILQQQKLDYQQQTLAEGASCYRFRQELEQVVFIAPPELDSTAFQNEERMTVTIEGNEIRFEKPAGTSAASPDEDFLRAEDDESEAQDVPENWSEFFLPLLKMQQHVEWNRDDHPEGNLLFHTLQTFEAGREKHPWDEEFLWACLLHDLGMVIDNRDPQTAVQRLLEGRVSDRVYFLITELPTAHEILAGAVPRKSLRKEESYEELLDLARCDRDARSPGKVVPTLEEAVLYLNQLDSLWDSE